MNVKCIKKSIKGYSKKLKNFFRKKEPFDPLKEYEKYIDEMHSQFKDSARMRLNPPIKVVTCGHLACSMCKLKGVK